MQIKRDSEGQLKQPQQGSISAMGVKGVAGAVPGAEGAPTRAARAREFLQRHTAHELIPESNKVVVLDTELPVRARSTRVSSRASWPRRCGTSAGGSSSGCYPRGISSTSRPVLGSTPTRSPR